MAQWHQQKSEKYHALCSGIRSKGWTVYFYAVEVGARGYCAETVRSCLRGLGFSNKVCRNTLKSVSSTSLKCSFEIWLTRNSRDWSLVDHSVPLPAVVKKSSSATYCKFPVVSSPRLVKRKRYRPGLINKGNTCYANVILQCLFSFPSFWSDQSSVPQCLSPLATAFRKVMFLLDRGAISVDPSPFLSALKESISKERDSVFDIYAQQDVVEILEHVLSELCGTSVVALESFKLRDTHTITCNTCIQSSSSEGERSIIQLPLARNIQLAVTKALETEMLEGPNAPFCHVCNSRQDGDTRLSFRSLGKFLVVQLRRFFVSDGKVAKDCSNILCCPSIVVPVEEDEEVQCNRKFNLVAVINHAGNLTSGHYSCLVKDGNSKWLFCNDKAVVPFRLENLAASHPYVLFYESE